MNYLGSKRRISKYLLPIILDRLKPGMDYVEPFVGGANMIDKIPDSFKRYGYDKNKYLISLFKSIQSGFIPPDNVSELEYNLIKTDFKNNGNIYPDYIKGFVGFCCAFGANFFSGYARCSKNTNYAKWGKNNILKQKQFINSVIFDEKDYRDIVFNNTSLIYCDPPYINSAKYCKRSTSEFNHEEFYNWCIDRKKEGHTVLISEQYMPDDNFLCILEHEIICNIDNKNKQSKKRVEKLYEVI